jgi:hypothetical protein
MKGFPLLWAKILDSSIWVTQSKETRLVWITMLAMKDSDGVVQASVVGLADRAKVSKEECMEALRIFLSPDADDTSKVEDGRRIREVPGGWQIINNDVYRFSTDAKREFWRQQKAQQRMKEENAARKKRVKTRRQEDMEAEERKHVREYEAGIVDENDELIKGEGKEGEVDQRNNGEVEGGGI